VDVRARGAGLALLATLASACIAHRESATPARADTPASASVPADQSAAAASWSKMEMNWQYVVYREAGRGIRLEIEPMFQVADVVYVPDAEAWAKSAPPWARARRDEILARLENAGWHRDLEWRESNESSVSTNLEPVPGSIESTPGGREMLRQRLFDPNSGLTAAQAREIWHLLVHRFALGARGEVHLFVDGSPKGSVFERVVLPALKENPHVKLVWHARKDGPGQ
jgi:hypothetical protein